MARRILLLIALLMLTCGSPTLAQIHISGPLSGVLVDTTYIVDGNITVPAGRSLLIQPGADFLFAGIYTFNIFGNLQAIGTPADSIRFLPAASAPRWLGLRFWSSTSDSSRLEYALVTQSQYGGIWCQGSSPTISHCTITQNYSPTFAAGLRIGGQRPVISDCVISHNRCQFEGGGIGADNGEPRIENCIITNNWSRYWGGGVEFLDTDGGWIINCLISRNVANSGGGIAILTSTGPLIKNCTIAYNRDPHGSSGGIYGGNTNSIIANCILWGNHPAQITGNVQVSYSDVQNGWPGVGNIDADPLFVSGPEGNYYLSQLAAGQTQQSPCVDAGDPLAPMIFGTTRTDGVPDSGVVDMGFHYPLPSSIETFTGDQEGEEFRTYNLEFRIFCRPNPFNASTVISFELPDASFVKLGVYDISGRLAAELVSGWREAGSHEVMFDASILPSGIYVARLAASGMSATQKLILLK